MKNRYRYLAENVFVFGVGNVLSKVVSFFLLSVFTQYLTPGEFGDAEIIISTISLLVPILTLCIADAVMRFILGKEDIEIVTTIGIVITLLGCGLSLLLSPIALFSSFVSKYYIFIFLLFALNSFEQLLFNVDKGLEKVKVCALNSLVGVVALIASSYYFLVCKNLGIHGYLISILLSHFCCCIYLFLFGKVYSFIHVKKYDKSVAKAMLLYSIPFVPSTITWWLNSVSDRYLIVFFLGSAYNGLYSAASKIPNIITIITSIFHQAWTISGIKEYDGKAYSVFYSNIYNVFSASIFISCSVLILFSQQIGNLLFKGDFGTSWRYVPFLIGGALFSSLCGMLSPAYMASKQTGKLMMSTVAGAVVNILINLAFLFKWGLQVAAISTFISFVVTWIIRWKLSKRIVELDLNLPIFIISVSIVLLQSIILLSTYYYRFYLCSFLCLFLVVLNIITILPYLRKLVDIKDKLNQ